MTGSPCGKGVDDARMRGRASCGYASCRGGGIPGGAMVFLALIFETFGLPVEVVALIAGIHTLNEMGLTTMNCLGDLVGTVIATFSGRDRREFVEPPSEA